MSNAAKVAEIFSAAGNAFSKLAELTMELHPMAQNKESGDGKWVAEEEQQLKSSLKRFGDDISRITENVKQRTVYQKKNSLKRKEFDSILAESKGQSYVKNQDSSISVPRSQIKPSPMQPVRQPNQLEGHSTKIPKLDYNEDMSIMNTPDDQIALESSFNINDFQGEVLQTEEIEEETIIIGPGD